MKKQKKLKGDGEIIRLQGIVRLLNDFQDRMFSLQRDMGNLSKKRVSKYLLNRYEGLFDWLKEE